MAGIRLSGLNRLSEVGRRLSEWSDRVKFLFVTSFEIIKARKFTRHLAIIRHEVAPEDPTFLICSRRLTLTCSRVEEMDTDRMT
jgi:hypothetical protein